MASSKSKRADGDGQLVCCDVTFILSLMCSQTPDNRHCVQAATIEGMAANSNTKDSTSDSLCCRYLVRTYWRFAHLGEQWGTPQSSLGTDMS